MIGEIQRDATVVRTDRGEAGPAQLARAAFQRVVVAALQLGHAGGVDVKAQHGALLAEFDRQRQANVAKTDDANPGGGEIKHDGDFS